MNVASPQDINYTSDFFAKISDEGVSSAKVVVPYLMRLIQPTSVVDVGCGTGAWLSIFQEHGVKRLCGLDGNWVSQEDLLITREDFHVVDLKNAWSIRGKYDLAISLEVGEHLPRRCADHLITELTRVAGAVLFSAALPGQQGTDHVNEQWADYWLEQFASHGFVRLDPIRRHVWQNPQVAWYYQQNLYLFVHKDMLSKHEEFQNEYELAQQCNLTLVHPKIIREATSLREALRRVGTLFRAAVRRRLPTF